MEVLIILMLISGLICGIENVLRLNQGQIIGSFLKSREGRVFKAYQGIPYAKPPIGDLRFKVKFTYYLEVIRTFTSNSYRLGNITFKSIKGFQDQFFIKVLFFKSKL